MRLWDIGLVLVMGPSTRRETVDFFCDVAPMEPQSERGASSDPPMGCGHAVSAGSIGLERIVSQPARSRIKPIYFIILHRPKHLPLDTPALKAGIDSEAPLSAP